MDGQASGAQTVVFTSRNCTDEQLQMPVQQIVYHMLRYFIKTERLTDCADISLAGTVSNYHIKTLMLRACELKSTTWWTDDVNLVRMCVQLLHNLAEWLRCSYCPHYFIRNRNLMENSSFWTTNIVARLMSVDETWLSAWFICHYIIKCSHLTPHNISRLFDDISTNLKLQNAVSAVVAWRRENSLLDLWEVFHTAEFLIAADLYRHSMITRSYVCWTSELAQIDSRLSIYCLALAFLQVANKLLLSSYRDIEELMNIMVTVCGPFTDPRRYPNNSTCSVMLSLNTGAKLTKVVANKILPSTMSALIELSQVYLYKAWNYIDFDSQSVFRLASVYLSVLYYTTGQYQTAIDHCRVVASSQDHSQSSTLVVQGDILPKLDDDIDNVLGLAVLYQYMRTSTMNNQPHHSQQVSVFTTKSFAHYLLMKYLPVTKYRQIHVMEMSSTDEFKQYITCINVSSQLFIGDVLLFQSVCQLLQFRHKPLWSNPRHTRVNAVQFVEHVTPADLVEFLQNSAVEYLTTYRQLLAQDFGSVATIVTTDFEALYAYKRGDYQRCLQLSTQNVHTLLYAVNMPDVTTHPMFIQLFSNDIVSLTALILMVNPRCGRKPHYIRTSQLTVSLYLMTQCQLKLHHSVTSLAQTLEYIEVAQRRHSTDRTMDQLTLKLIGRKAEANITFVLTRFLSDYLTL